MIARGKVCFSLALEGDHERIPEAEEHVSTAADRRLIDRYNPAVSHIPPVERLSNSTEVADACERADCSARLQHARCLARQPGVILNALIHGIGEHEINRRIRN